MFEYLTGLWACSSQQCVAWREHDSYPAFPSDLYGIHRRSYLLGDSLLHNVYSPQLTNLNVLFGHRAEHLVLYISSAAFRVTALAFSHFW